MKYYMLVACMVLGLALSGCYRDNYVVAEMYPDSSVEQPHFSYKYKGVLLSISTSLDFLKANNNIGLACLEQIQLNKVLPDCFMPVVRALE